jgi:hypothetical protein
MCAFFSPGIPQLNVPIKIAGYDTSISVDITTFPYCSISVSNKSVPGEPHLELSAKNELRRMRLEDLNREMMTINIERGKGSEIGNIFLLIHDCHVKNIIIVNMILYNMQVFSS